MQLARYVNAGKAVPLFTDTATGKAGSGFSLPRFGPHKNTRQQAKAGDFHLQDSEQCVSPTMTFFFGVTCAN